MPRLEPEEGQGQAEPVVEVALRPQDAEAGREELGGELLGRRLADAARDPDDPDGVGGEDRAGQALEGRDRVRDLDQPEAGDGDGDGPRNDGPGRAPGGGGGDEVVAVPASGDGEEELAGDGQPRIDAEGPEGEVRPAAEDAPSGRAGHFREPQRGHGQAASLAARISRMTSMSLKWMVRSLKI